MAEIVLGFTEKHIQKMANNTKNLNNTDDVEDEEYFFQTKYDIIAILIVVSITSLCLTIYCMWWFRLGCFKNWQPPTQGPYAQTTEEVDAENPKVGSLLSVWRQNALGSGVSESRKMLSHGGAELGGQGALAPPPPSFGDLFSKFWEFLKIHFSLFTIAPPP